MTRFLNLASVEYLLCFPLKWSWSQGCGVRDEDEERCLPKPSHLGHQHCLLEVEGSLLSPGTLRPQSLSGNHCSTEQDSLCFSQLPLFLLSVLKIIKKKKRLPFPLTAVVLVKISHIGRNSCWLSKLFKFKAVNDNFIFQSFLYPQTIICSDDTAFQLYVECTVLLYTSVSVLRLLQDSSMDAGIRTPTFDYAWNRTVNSSCIIGLLSWLNELLHVKCLEACLVLLNAETL